MILEHFNSRQPFSRLWFESASDHSMCYSVNSESPPAIASFRSLVSFLSAQSHPSGLGRFICLVVRLIHSCSLWADVRLVDFDFIPNP